MQSGEPLDPLANEFPAVTSQPKIERPRLSIAHLLLWMAGTAVALTYFRQFFWNGDSGDAARNQLQLAQRVFACLQAPFYGAAISSVPLAVWQWCRGNRSFPTQPGHWLLLLQGVSIVAGILAILIIVNPTELITSSYEEAVRHVSQREFWCLLPTLTGVVLALRQCSEKRWRVMFWLMLMGYASAILFFGAAGELFKAAEREGGIACYNIATSLLWFFQTLATFVLVFCVLADRAERLPRDFLHTTGVVVRFALVFCGWGGPLIFHFFARL